MTRGNDGQTPELSCRCSVFYLKNAVGSAGPISADPTRFGPRSPQTRSIPVVPRRPDTEKASGAVLGRIGPHPCLVTANQYGLGDPSAGDSAS